MSNTRGRNPLDTGVKLGIPSVSADPESLRQGVIALTTAVQQLSRQRGNVLHSSVTVADLLKLNLVPPEAVNVLDEGGTFYRQEGLANMTRASAGTSTGGGSGGGLGVEWNDILNRPAVFAPSPHGHPWSAITDLPDGFTPSPHSHLWSEIVSKPSTFTPSAHTHPWAHLTDLPDFATRWPTWGEVTDKPAEFPPAPHTHLEADITDLGDYEPNLGTPPVGGYVLASTTGGVRSWVEMTGGGGGSASPIEYFEGDAATIYNSLVRLAECGDAQTIYEIGAADLEQGAAA